MNISHSFSKKFLSTCTFPALICLFAATVISYFLRVPSPLSTLLGYLTSGSIVLFYSITELSTLPRHKQVIAFLPIFLLALIFIFCGDVFSPIDEAAHYYNANYIALTGQLPNMIDFPDYYEAVHPPLYYLLASIPCRLITNRFIRVYLLRFLGFLLLVTCANFSQKAVHVLAHAGLVVQPRLLQSLVLFFFFSPGVLVRFCTISNESLAVFFSVLVFYSLIHLICHGFSQRTWLFCTLFFTCAVYTKITAVFWLAPMFCVFFWLKRSRYIFASAGIASVSLLPWLLYNWHLYHAITGTAYHLAYVRQNPNTKVLSFWESFSHLFSTLFFPNEGIVGGWLNIVLSLLNLVCMSAAVFLLGHGCICIVRCLLPAYRFSRSPEALFFFFQALCTISTAACLSTIIYGTLSTGVDVLAGRYLMHILPPIILSASLILSKAPSYISTFFRVFAVSCMAFFSMNTAQQFLLSYILR